MKSNRGLTITSVIIYVIAMLIVIGIVATISSFFYTNVNNVNDNSDNVAELTKFHMYFLAETTKENNQVYSVTNTQEKSSISFTSGNTFTYHKQDNSIYLNHIKICENINGMQISVETSKDSSNLQFSNQIANDKTIINVLITIGNNNEYTKTTSYVLGNM